MEKNLIIIEEKTITTANGNKIVNCLQMRNFAGYDFCDGGGNCDIALGFFSSTENESEIIEKFEPQIFMIVNVPNEIVKTWGESDEPIINHVLKTLDLKIKTSFFQKILNIFKSP